MRFQKQTNVFENLGIGNCSIDGFQNRVLKMRGMNIPELEAGDFEKDIGDH
jgi:hypothetical protein